MAVGGNWHVHPGRDCCCRESHVPVIPWRRTSFRGELNPGTP